MFSVVYISLSYKQFQICSLHRNECVLPLTEYSSEVSLKGVKNPNNVPVTQLFLVLRHPESISEHYQMLLRIKTGPNFPLRKLPA